MNNECGSMRAGLIVIKPLVKGQSSRLGIGDQGPSPSSASFLHTDLW